MDIKFTFEDGSEALAHYGVKGMKWKKRKKIQDELYVNQDEFNGDPEGLKKANQATAARYGLLGKLAQKTQKSKDRANRKRFVVNMKRSGFKQGADGVWRKS